MTNDLHIKWGWFFALGILLMIGGISALLSPYLASVVVEMLVGGLFTVSGIIMLVQVFITKKGWNARMIFLILGLFNTLAGLLLLSHPLEGLMALTLVMIVAFFVGGLIRIAFGVMARPEFGSDWVIASGVISVVLSGYLLMQYPGVSVMLVGILVGLSLIGEGAGYVRYSYGLKASE